ncbi:polysaccharide deacetylase family protein [Cytobacillus sp. FSL K6-0129]|uniref:polysaccharide deacetylase family protein n=1 Tax=Cytobacillus sp. FSL K6-0129 TaxID=2921421 RepID=UPI0030F57DEC
MAIRWKTTDSHDAIRYTALDAHKQPVNLIGATARFLMGKRGDADSVIINEPAQVVDEMAGKLAYELTEIATLEAGTFNAEFHVEWPDGSRKVFPSEGYLAVTVAPSLDVSKVGEVEERIILRVSQIEEFKDEIVAEVDGFRATVGQAEDAAVEAEVQADYAKTQADRAKTEADRLEGTDVSILDNKVNDVDSRLTAQLAEKANESEVRKNTSLIPINVSEMDTETKQLFTGGSVAVVGEKAVGNENLKEKAVDPVNTTFFVKTKNLFDGRYHNASLRRTGVVDNYLYFVSKPSIVELGRTAIVEIEPNSTYTVKIHDTDLSNTLRIALHSKVPTDGDYNINNEYLLNTYVTYQSATGFSYFTFTSGANDKYLFVQTSTEGKEPKLQIEKGTTSTDYESPFYLNPDFIKQTNIEPGPTPNPSLIKSVYEELRGNIFQRNYSVDKLFKASDAVVAAGDVSLSDVSNPKYQRNNSTSMKVTVNSPINFRIDFPLSKPIDLYRKEYALLFYLPTESTKTPRQANFAVLAIYLTTLNGSTYVVYPENDRRYPGWNAIIGNPMNKAVVSQANDVDLTNVTNIRIHLNVDSNITEPYDIYFDSFASWDYLNKPTVRLEFDDAIHTVYENAFPLMAERGMRGATHVITKNIITEDPLEYTTNDGLIRMHDVGWDICSHSRNHHYISTLTEQEQLYELEQSQKDLLSLGLRNGPQFYIAPYGDNTLYATEQARKFYVNYRMTGYRPGTSVFPVLPYAMEAINAGSRGLAGCIDLIDKAVKTGGHLPLMWHGEIGETWGGVMWQTSEFKDMLDYLIEKDVKVVTYSDQFPNSQVR